MSAGALVRSGSLNGVLMLIEEEETAANLQAYARDAEAAHEILSRLVALGPITRLEDAHERVELSSRVAIALKGLEDQRKKAVKVRNDEVRAINEAVASVTLPAQQVVDAVKRQKRAWDEQELARERREREEQERQMREAAEAEEAARAKAEAATTAKQRAKALADQAAASEAQAAAAAVTVRPAATGVKGDGGSMSPRKVWTFEVVDPEQVPRRFLVIDEAKIRAAVKAGERAIPGVNVFEDTQQVQRVRG